MKAEIAGSTVPMHDGGWGGLKHFNKWKSMGTGEGMR